MRERGEQQLVLDRDRRVEHGPELVALDVELAAQLEVAFDDAAVGLVARLAVFLVVVDLGDGAAPVDDEMPVVVIGHADVADVDVLGLAAGLELERDLGEVGLLEEQLGTMEALGRDVGGDVVGVDDAVDGLDLGHGLDVNVGIEVEVQLVGDEVLVGGDLA